MSDTRSQLEEIDALIAATPDDPALHQLREDLLQLIALEEQEQSTLPEDAEAQKQPHSAGTTVGNGDVPSSWGAGKYYHAEGSQKASGYDDPHMKPPSDYTAQGTFMEHRVSTEAVAEAPDIGAFQPVVKSQPQLKSSGDDQAEAGGGGAANLKGDPTNGTSDAAVAATIQSAEKKKKKKRKKDENAAVLAAKFELPSHLVPLESDTQAQRLKKQRAAKALKSKFRERQKEAEQSKRQNDWKSFATGGGGKKRKKAVVQGSSIFSTEEGVNARVGVISGSGGRKMTGFADTNKRHKF